MEYLSEIYHNSLSICARKINNEKCVVYKYMKMTLYKHLQDKKDNKNG